MSERASPPALAARFERWGPWMAGALLAAPILAFRYPPMGDLPLHEASVALLRHAGDVAFTRGLYVVVAPQANQLFFFAACALAYVVASDAACKLVVAAAVGLSVVLAGELLAKVGRSRWPALLVAPVACGWMFRWGLVANLVGFAAFFAAMTRLETRARQQPTVADAALLSLATLAVFFAHESSALLFAIAAAYAALVRATRGRDLALRLTPVATFALLALSQHLRARGLEGPTMAALPFDLGPAPLDRIALLPGALFGGIGAPRLALLGGLSLAALVASAWTRGVRERRLPVRASLWRQRYVALAALYVALYLAFPMSLGGTTLLAHRFLAGAWGCAIVACAFTRATRPRVALIALVPVALVGSEWSAFHASDRRARDLDPVLAAIPEGSSVAQLDLSASTGEGHVAPVPPLASRVLAERGGRMLFAMTDMPPNPIDTRRDARWDEPTLRLVRAPFAFAPAYDATRFAYLVTLNGGPKLRAAVQAALAPEEEKIASSGPWDLYRSTLTVAAIDAPDHPLPAPPPETLAERLRRAGAIR